MNGMKYSDIVDYDKLDPFKEESIKRLKGTLNNPNRLGVHIVPETIGETAVAVGIKYVDFYLAFNIEGLGTKNMIAEVMAEKERIGAGIGIDRRKLFAGLGRDEMAMTLNDLTAIGATPILFEPIVATGDSNYLTDSEISAGIIDGFEYGANYAKVAIPGGETPTLKGIVGANTIDVAGASMGIIQPKSRLTTGRNLESGLTIFGISSSGVHSNGISLTRKIAEKTREGYFTKLPSGRTIGEALLTPTVIYSPLVESLFDGEVDVRYMQPITGHGWAKIMRKNKPLRYVIEAVPQPQEEFKFLQEQGPVDDEEAYQTWNMSIGLVVMAPSNDASRVRRAAEKNNLESYELGTIEDGEREVLIAPKGITYRAK